MEDAATHRLFLWLDRAFWLIWLGFSVLIWLSVQAVLNAPDEILALAPDQAACLADLPMVASFSTAGRWIFWGGFGYQVAFYAVILGMAHQVIHRCATGRVFVDRMISTLRTMGWLIALFPVIDLILANLALLAFVATGDMPVFQPNYGLDIPVIGVGLMLVTIAAAMRMAVQLHQDAELTI
jgi:Protein of unknown function (DUF2975)